MIAQYVGWHMYFLGSGLFVTACCFVFYMLFDRIEAIVEARDIAELALEHHSHTQTTAGARHGIG